MEYRFQPSTSTVTSSIVAGFTTQTVFWVTLLLGGLIPAVYMFRDTLRGGVEASMRYLYNKASTLGLSSFSDEEITPAERARHIERFRGSHVGGLYNEGNTCFINSVVQSLASCGAVSEFTEAHKRAEQDNFSAGLADIVTNLNQIHSNAHGYSTNRLMQTIGGSERWNRLDQEDAQEFFQQLLQTLEKDWKHLHGPATEEQAEKQSKDPIRITPFDGDFAVRVGCLRCGDMEGIRRGVVSSVDLSLDSGIQSARLTQLLDNYCAMETISGVECYRCSLIAYRALIQERLEQPTMAAPLRSAFQARISEVDAALAHKVIDEKRYTQLKCNTHRVQSDKTKQTMFARPTPEVLMIHINRSVFDLRTGFVRKNYAPVEFPIVLDLSPYVTDPKDTRNEDPRTQMRPVPTLGDEENDLRYALKAAVIHYGSANFGHYVSFRKFDGLWWRISDDSVDLTTEAQVLNAQGIFMLFYERLPVGAETTQAPSESKESDESMSDNESETVNETGNKTENNEDNNGNALSSAEKPDTPAPSVASPSKHDSLEEARAERL